MSEQDSTSSALKLEWIPIHKGDGQTSGIDNAEPLITSGHPAWNCRDTSTSSWEDDSAYGGDSGERGRVITVQWDECTKTIGIDGSSHEAIKRAIKSSFGLKPRHEFWLEDEHEVVRPLDRDMPLTTYIMHLVEGLVLKVCLSAAPNHASCDTVEKELYTEDDFTNFLGRRGWIGLKGSRDDQIIDMIDDLKPDVVYHGLMRRLTGST